MVKQIYNYQQKNSKPRWSKSMIFLMIPVAFITFALVGNQLGASSEDSPLESETSSYFRPGTDIQEVAFKASTELIDIQWPKSIQSSVGVVGLGVLSSSETNPEPLPMASIAKIMAAIMIIEKDNLVQDTQGSTITFDEEDEALYNKYLLEDGVVTTIKAGGNISQREALDAMLIKSSNNIADSAIISSFGSIDQYLVRANAKAKELGLEKTHFADVTGFSPKTTSTADELLKLSDYAMKKPLFVEIVGTWEKTILNKVLLTNSNSFLDFENNSVIGVKSGFTDEAGGTFVGAARYIDQDGNNVVALAVTLGANTHFEAQEKSVQLLESVRDSLNLVNP